MNSLADLTKDIAHDISKSEAFHKMKTQVDTFGQRPWARYVLVAAGVASVAVIVGYGVRSLLRTEKGQRLSRNMKDRLSSNVHQQMFNGSKQQPLASFESSASSV